MKESIDKIFKTIYKGDEDSLQKSLLILKKEGFTQVDVVKLLIHEFNLTLKEADKIVFNSKAWEEERDATLNIRNDLGDELSI